MIQFNDKIDTDKVATDKVNTIVAPATAMVNSGIGIIRISGDDAVNIVSKVYPEIINMQSHTIKYGFILDKDEKVDEVLVTFMKGPKSYTKEDIVEINCHGGIVMMKRIIGLILANGARLAEPGEFTKRAFLNGRIDLARAEAVMDLIQSRNEMALKNSLHQLTGSLSEVIKSLRDDIIYYIAYIEAALDDPEHITLDDFKDQLSARVDEIIGELISLIKSFESGKLIRDGIQTVILGKPNAGKSSLLNRLLEEDRAIVTDIPGTTRDILAESLSINGILLNLVDTAGVRDTDHPIEKIGIERTKKYAIEADLIIYLVDSSVELDENDYEIMKLINENHKEAIILLNKTDLDTKITKEDVECVNNSYQGFDNQIVLSTIDFECGRAAYGYKNKNGDNIYPQVNNSVDIVDFPVDKPVIIETSVKNNIGLDLLAEQIYNMFISGKIMTDDELLITNIRHKEAVQNAYESMNLVKQSILDQMPEDFYTIDLLSAYKYLGYIIGEEMEEDLINKIFLSFCIGK